MSIAWVRTQAEHIKQGEPILIMKTQARVNNGKKRSQKQRMERLVDNQGDLTMRQRHGWV